MDEFAGRLLADRYRLPQTPSEEYELRESVAYDTASGQDVVVRQVPLPEVVDAEVLGGSGLAGWAAGRATREPADPGVRRAVEAALAAARIPDHPRLDQVFDVFVEDDGLWVVSELVAGRPLDAVLADRPLTPHRAAEIAADLLAALSAVHTYGWTHRNITARSVLICDDGRALLTGLASGAAEEALCGYDPLPADGPVASGEPMAPDGPVAPPEAGPAEGGAPGSGPSAVPPGALGAEERRSLPGPRADGAPEHREARAEREPAPRHGPWGGDKPGPAARAPQLPPPPPEYAYAGGHRAGPVHEHGTDPAYAHLFRPDRDDAPGYDVHEHEAHGHDTPGYDAPGYDEGAYGYGAASHGYDDEGQPGAVPDVWGDPEPVPPPHAEAEAAVVSEPEPESGERYRGPATSLAAERARQARMTIVGAVTERWAPEQAGPVYENWRLAPPVGPSADLWAIGALLFRAVQGHAPYPEDSAAELVQLVCAEPPAYAEECGPLRPVIESLLRQDPTERPEFEELAGWLRSLIRSAPEPEAGRRVVTAAPPLTAGRTDPRRLPILRRRGELVRRRRAEKRPVPADRTRHRKARSNRSGSPRRLGAMLVGLVLVGLVTAIVVAVLAMPPADPADPNRRGSVGEAPVDPDPADSRADGDAPTGQPEQGQEPDQDQEPEQDEERTGKPGTQTPQSGEPGPAAPDGYETRRDPAGFHIAVPEGWARGQGSAGQVRFSQGGLQLIVVPGRDGTSRYGADPREYQLAGEPELADYRDATGWKTVSGVRSITVGETAMAEGEFVWESGGERTLIRNRAVLLGSKYHVVLVRGPEDRRTEIDEHFSQVVDTYRPTG
ncbi:serine/threonine protein kinase [Streptomyces sp. TRM 70351]|uniref:serine/threonine protein kinase n=1 Tax=Streptomyces sp. TRM 70351 TaxID=3116552 RepID=UPI002E7B0C2B|nr:serine/threonine protein kinase [Streptomyces sp. TRM 70351]MEE1928002.1 serine/threonine protein kinase [Streptomyces sp. TRM 70351]